MKIKHFLLVALLLCLGAAIVRAGGTNSLNADMQALMTKIRGKLQGGQRSESDFTNEMKGFDDLLAKHKDAKPDEAATILYTKARLYQQVFHNSNKSDEI